MKSRRLSIHLIANAHLDPVWLWDWKEGLNEGITTVRSIVKLMAKFPDLTFIRGESAIYRHIEENDPATFLEIKKLIQTGRWDVVGGTEIQPDTNLPATETLLRHFTHGQRYFKSRFGVRVTAAWQADSFGHSAGLPDILAAAGMDSFAFSRPDSKIVPISEPAFWWEGEGGGRVLAYRIPAGFYGNERHDMRQKLDDLLEIAAGSALDTMGCFYGLGNHGGGPSVRHLRDIREWTAQHPEVEVLHSGLHRFFRDLRKEIATKPGRVVPTHCGELNYCLRGCYSSVAKFKFAYRKAENLLVRSEKAASVLGSLARKAMPDLRPAWDQLLFNSFHDILPGSSIERAMDDQIAALGSIVHATQQAEFAALNALALRVDTRVAKASGDHPTGVAALVWNPHPFPREAWVELEAGLDYRIIWQYQNRRKELPIEVKGPDGSPLAFQEIETENDAITDFPWRKRVLVPLSLPAFGWNVVEMGWVEGATNPALPKEIETTSNTIENAHYKIEAHPGSTDIRILHQGKSIFGKRGLSAVVFEDPWGSWGGMREEHDSNFLRKVLETWSVTHVQKLESGPHRASLWVRLAGARSRIDLTFCLTRDTNHVEVGARVLWDDRSARLKLIMPVGDQATFQVPGGTAKRGPSGEVPGTGWVQVDSPAGGFGFTSDGLYNFDTIDGEFRATVVRSTRYASDTRLDSSQEIWKPAVDCGELKFQFVFAPGTADLEQLTAALEQPPLVLLVRPKAGPLPRTGSPASLSPSTLKLLTLKPAEKGNAWILRVQNLSVKKVSGRFTWLGEKLTLDAIRAGEIATWKLTRAKTLWKTTRVGVDEEPL